MLPSLLSPQQAREAFQFLPEAASEFADRVDKLFYYQIGLSVFFSALVFGLVFFFAVKYRRRRRDEWPKKLKEDMRLEIMWSTIPGVFAMVMFFWGAVLFFDLRQQPADRAGKHIA